jgi:hypothetical protein
MKQFFLSIILLLALMVYVPVMAGAVTGTDNEVVKVANEVQAIVEQADFQQIIQSAPPQLCYTMGFDWNILESDFVIGILVLLLGFLGISWVLVAKYVAPIANGLKTAATTGTQAAATLQQFGLDQASTIVKEGSDVVDELGDVANVLATTTVDGKFTVDDAKKVLKEGKDVVVAMKDFILIVKPKKD